MKLSIFMTVHLNLPSFQTNASIDPPKKDIESFGKQKWWPKARPPGRVSEVRRSQWWVRNCWTMIWSYLIYVNWSELNRIELHWIWYNVYVIGHCLSANWHRWFNSLCRNWDWNSKSDGCAKVRRSGLCSGHMILPFMSFSFYKGIFKRIFRFLAFLEE